MHAKHSDKAMHVCNMTETSEVEGKGSCAMEYAALTLTSLRQ